MPLTINVGLNRKTSENYNSKGASINVAAELDQSLLARPHELQGAINELYEQAEIALQRQCEAGEPEQQHDNGPTVSHRNGGNGKKSNGGGGMTDSQRRAIEAISRRLDVDPVEEARHLFGSDIKGLSIREASKFIDHLKSLQVRDSGNGHPHAARNGGRR